MKEKEYESLSISQDDDGDYKLQFYYEGRKVSDFLICKKRMEQIASMIFIHKACEWLESVMLNDDIYGVGNNIENLKELINDFKKAMNDELQ